MALRDSVLSVVIRAKDLAGKTLRRFRTDLDEVDTTSQKTGTAIGSLTKRLLSLAAAAVGIHTVTRALTSMLSTGDKFEKLALQMEQTMGSLEEGQRATEWVKQFAKDTPLQMQEVTETFVRLKNFGLDPMNGTMQAVIDQAAALGGGYERVQGISIALGQAWAKQKLQGEEILQLIERGVPVWDMLAEVTGKSTAELQKMSQAGQLGRDVMRQLIAEMGRRNTGAAADNMSLLSGYISNLKDEWALFLNEIAQSGALDYAKDQLSGLLATIQRMRDSGELQQLAQSISDGFVTIAETTKSVVLAIKENTGALGLLAKAYAALKLASVLSSARALATTMAGQLVAGTKAAAVQTRLLAGALATLPWLAVIEGVTRVAGAYQRMRESQRQLAESQAKLNDIQQEAQRRIQEFNQQTGLAAQSLDDMIRAQDAGIAIMDEYTGQWRRANEQVSEAEQSHREQADAAKAALAEISALNTQVQNLVQTFKDTRGEGKTLEETIAAVGSAANDGGEQGIHALSIAIERLALEGQATREELSSGLGDYLASLSDEEYSRFGKRISEELERVESGADSANNRLSFMQTLLEANLSAAAKRAGIDVGQVLTGIDEQSRKSISAFSDLVQQVKATSTESAEADKIIKAGLMETLKGLNATEEIDATVAAIRRLGESGDLSADQVRQLTEVVKQQAEQVKRASEDAGNAQLATNRTVVDSIRDVARAHDDQAVAIDQATGAGVALANVYRAIRASVDELGPAASSAFEKLQGIDTGAGAMSGEFADLKKTIQESANEIDRMRFVSAADFSGIMRFVQQTASNAAQVRKEYAEQKLALEQLKQGYEEGSVSVAKFADRARAAMNSTSLLGQQDLAYLRNAIRAAEQQMESFRDSTQSTLNSLQSELAQLQGDAQKVAQLNYEARVADLENQLEEAERSGDRDAIANAQKALQIARDIYRTKVDQIKTEREAAEQDKREQDERRAAEERERQEQELKPDPATPGREDAVRPVPQPSGQRVELALPNGSIASIAGEPEDVNRLLDFLNEAGLRATQ